MKSKIGFKDLLEVSTLITLFLSLQRTFQLGAYIASAGISFPSALPLSDVNMFPSWSSQIERTGWPLSARSRCYLYISLYSWIHTLRSSSCQHECLFHVFNEKCTVYLEGIWKKYFFLKKKCIRRNWWECVYAFFCCMLSHSPSQYSYL